MTGSGTTVRALVVQESSARREELIETLQLDGDIAVVGRAGTATEAIRQVHLVIPDVVVLDLHMRDRSSLLAIEQIMAGDPTPIVVLSTGLADSPSAAEALRAGALDALPTPAHWTQAGGTDLRRSVRQASDVTVIRHPRGSLRGTVHRPSPIGGAHRPVVAIGASTGGPAALACVLSGLAGLPAPVLIVQHLHADFTAGLLTWMSRVSALPVQMAEHRLAARPGHVYLAPGGVHLQWGPDFHLELTELPASLHRPSADQLFHSVAENAGTSAVGVLLTGMGADGADGLLHIHVNGGRTLAQDEASSAVFGMPQAAHRLGAVSDLLPLDRIAVAIGKAVLEITG